MDNTDNVIQFDFRTADLRRTVANILEYRDHGKVQLFICYKHADKLTGEQCPYCRIADLEAELAALRNGNG